MTASLTAPTPAGAGKRWFLPRLTLATAGGDALDGYDLGGISVVLPLIAADLHLTSAWAGLIGASSLLGIFFGGPLGGALTDRFGRRRVFLLDLAAFVALGLLQVAVTTGWQLFVVRLLLGLAIGAEYSVGATLLAEFAPAKGRGRRLAGLEVSWYVGYLLSVVAGYGLLALGVHWRWVLASSAIPAAGCLLLRLGLPESPRWLLSVGRAAEARAVVDAHLGGEGYFAREDFGGEPARRGGGRVKDLFAPGLRRRTAFVCIFWACLIAPYFAIFTFAPAILTSLHLTDARAGQLATNGVAALGALAGMVAIERVGRRAMLIAPFWVSAAALLAVGLVHPAPAWVVLVAFVVFSFCNAVQGDLTAVYPTEVFPTAVRSVGTGVGAAASRIGAAAGTFLLPVGLSAVGVGPCMVVAAGVCALGAVVSHLWAPETTGRLLTETSRVGMAYPSPRAASTR